MKHIISLLMPISLLFVTQCSSSRDPLYSFPKGMNESLKADFRKQCDKGKILYDINCAPCHISNEKGKTKIPNYTLNQLKSYEFRVLNSSHENHLTENTLSREELGLIITFLMYKKKSK